MSAARKGLCTVRDHAEDILQPTPEGDFEWILSDARTRHGLRAGHQSRTISERDTTCCCSAMTSRDLRSMFVWSDDDRQFLRAVPSACLACGPLPACTSMRAGRDERLRLSLQCVLECNF